jgi:hypothetical protein
MNNSPYCDLIDTNTVFNNKKVYRCSYCGIQIGLDNIDTKMICFKKMQDYSLYVRQIVRPNQDATVSELKPGEIAQDLVLNNLLEKQTTEQENQNNPSNLCTDNEIESRLSICRTCEFYQDDTCSLCGCHIVREANHMNKLAHKDQACPAGKWGPIY